MDAVLDANRSLSTRPLPSLSTLTRLNIEKIEVLKNMPTETKCADMATY